MKNQTQNQSANNIINFLNEILELKKTVPANADLFQMVFIESDIYNRLVDLYFKDCRTLPNEFFHLDACLAALYVPGGLENAFHSHSLPAESFLSDDIIGFITETVNRLSKPE